MTPTLPPVTSRAAHTPSGNCKGVTDCAPAGQWCGATQAAEALTRLQQMVAEAIVQGYLSTAAKRGVCFIDALVMLTEGQPWMPATA